MSGHPGRLIDHQHMFVFPENGQGPGTGRNNGRGRTVVSGLNVQPVPGLEDEGSMHRLSVDQDAVRDPDQAGDGVGGEVEPRPQDMTDRGSIVFRRIIQPGIFSGRGPAAPRFPDQAGRRLRYHGGACP